MDEYNFKFRVVKNIGKESLMYFGEPGTIHNVENGSFFYSISTWNNNGILYKTIEDVKNHISVKDRFETEIELVEESEELTPVEFLQLCHEICDDSSDCGDCMLFGKCFDCSNSNIEKTYEIVKQYKKDKQAKEKQPVYVAKWSYDCYLDDKLMDNVETEEQAIKRCEELLSENPFDNYATYKKVCKYEEESNDK